MHDVTLRGAAVLQQVAGGQDSQQATGLAEGNAGHAQQLSCSSPLKGAGEEGQEQQGVQELIWEGAHNVADTPARQRREVSHPVQESASTYFEFPDPVPNCCRPLESWLCPLLEFYQLSA